MIPWTPGKLSPVPLPPLDDVALGKPATASSREAPGMAAGHTADARVITWVQTAAGVEDRIELPGKRAGALWAARGHAMALGVAAVVLAAASACGAACGL